MTEKDKELLAEFAKKGLETGSGFIRDRWNDHQEKKQAKEELKREQDKPAFDSTLVNSPEAKVRAIIFFISTER